MIEVRRVVINGGSMLWEEVVFWGARMFYTLIRIIIIQL